MMRHFALLAACFLLHNAGAATYYVEKTGSDSAVGSSSAPWLTIGKAAATMVAGDTVLIGPGDFDEHVQESTAGAENSRITYRSRIPGAASMRAFRLSAAYLTLDGIRFTKYSGVSNVWAAAVRVEPSATKSVITNCTFTDYPYVKAHDFTFDVATNKITSASSDFVKAGFQVGSKIYLGASGATVASVPLYYVNHDTTWTVATVATTNMTLTAGSAPFEADSGTGYWAFVRAGGGSGGYPCVQCIIVSGVGPVDGTISNCTAYDWPADAFDIKGSGWLVENNYVSDLKSFKFITFSGSDHIIRRNLVKDVGNVLHYTPAELDTLVHPGNTGWYDYVTTVLAGFVTSGVNHQNVLVEENWIQNVENQIGRVDDELAGAFDIRYNRNVIVGVSAPFSGGRDGMEWTNNTFFRCAFNGGAHPLAIGGREPPQSGYVLTGNLFVACGSKDATQTLTRGYYSVSDNAVSPVKDLNFVTSEEVTGYDAKSNFTETNGVNGGDPLFYDESNPLGVDGVPFTDDDGLKVLSTSPAAVIGGGALGVREVSSGRPLAQFRVTSPNGWFEPTEEEFDTVWLAQLPTVRGATERPYDTPVKLGNAGQAVTFNASASMSGVGGATTNTDIVEYEWEWGDGGPNTVTSSASTTHTFSTHGDRKVTLTVTNSLGATHSVSTTYRIGGDVLLVPSEYATVQLAVTAAVAGDTIRIASGRYDESVLTSTDGTATGRITIEGVGQVVLTKVTVRDPYYTLRNLRFTPASTAFGEAIWLRRNAHFTRIENCYIDLGVKKDVCGVEWETPSTSPFGTDAASDCVITRSVIENGFNDSYVSMYGDRNVVEDNVLRDGIRIDFFRVFGRENVLRRNTCYNNFNTLPPGTTGGNHADFLQCFGNNGFGSKDHVVEGNFLRYIENGQLTQFEGNLLPDIGNWVIRNNVFADVALQSSCTIPGVKYYNNTFFQCNWRNLSHVLNFGRRAYDITNCAPNAPNISFLGPKVSGELEVGRFYRVDAPTVASGEIVSGTVYRVEGTSSGRVTYDGVQYSRNQLFTGTSTTTFTQTETDMTVHRNASVTHNGVVYVHEEEFEAVNANFSVTTYDPVVQGIEYNEADGCEVWNNVFYACGGTGLGRGWYSFDTLLEDISADYNYVAKEDWGTVTFDTLLRPIGNPGGWDSQKWYEPNGINGGNPFFRSVPRYDFRVLDDSFLTDRGYGSLGVSSDKVSVPRPLGSGTDIGAYEFFVESEYIPETPTPSINASNVSAQTTTIQ